MLQQNANVAIEMPEDMNATAAVQEFLTFRLGDEEYGIDILKVQEIRGYDAITQISNAPEFIKGVVNLRSVYCCDYSQCRHPYCRHCRGWRFGCAQSIQR